MFHSDDDVFLMKEDIQKLTDQVGFCFASSLSFFVVVSCRMFSFRCVVSCQTSAKIDVLLAAKEKELVQT